jgi:hypothetical protein
MDNWLKLDDPVQIRAYSEILKRLTDPAHFEEFGFMPVTRDMSAGERTLFYNFLSANNDQAFANLSEKTPTGLNFAELSRAMRRGWPD